MSHYGEKNDENHDNLRLRRGLKEILNPHVEHLKKDRGDHPTNWTKKGRREFRIKF